MFGSITVGGLTTYMTTTNTANKGTVASASVANFLQGIAQSIGGCVSGSDVNRLPNAPIQSEQCRTLTSIGMTAGVSDTEILKLVQGEIVRC